tara:strand:- start:7200 stop:8711 length:1512 start_codon:yes stop_codon:yes gene_type:complete
MKKYGNISTGSIESTLAAEEILKYGGNAFDAAIGAVFVSMTSEFALTGAFGGGILMGIENNNSPFIYDFFVDCPKNNNSNKEFVNIEVDFGETKQSFYVGRGSIAIPGNIMGLLQIHENHGRLPLSDILKPAIEYAKNGITISSYQAYVLKIIEPIITYDKSSKKLFSTNNQLISRGDIFKNYAFVDFLNILIQKGYKYFYNGPGLDVIFNFLKDKSNLCKNDFQSYKVYKRNPISLNFNNHIIYSNPSPSYGGTLISFLLTLIKDSKNYSIFDIINAMNLSSQVRNEVCLNPNDENEISNALNQNILSKYQKKFDNQNFINFSKPLHGFGSTTHLSILDNNGNAVSMTTTNGEGCGAIIPEYGIMMNNMLGEYDLNPFGFHKWGTKRRLPTMMSPTIITKDSKPQYILGSGGSNRIRSANIQVILNLLLNKMSLSNAVDAPRIHLEGNTLFHEPGINIPCDKLKNIIINSFNDKNLFFGGVNAVSPNSAVGDSRRGGHGIIS